MSILDFITILKNVSSWVFVHRRPWRDFPLVSDVVRSNNVVYRESWTSKVRSPQDADNVDNQLSTNWSFVNESRATRPELDEWLRLTPPCILHYDSDQLILRHNAWKSEILRSRLRWRQLFHSCSVTCLCAIQILLKEIFHVFLIEWFSSLSISIHDTSSS